MKTASVNIPCFTGFYESIWHNSDSEYYLAQDIQSEAEGIFDFQHLDDWYVSQDYYDEVGQSYSDVYIDLIRSYLHLDELELHFDCIHSPRYYNYSTDEIYATFAWPEEYDLPGQIVALMEQHREALSETIHRYHTSYDGFWSTMDNDFDKWLEHIKDEDDDRYMNYAILYLLRLEMGIRDLDGYIYDCVEPQDYNYFQPTTEEAKAEYDQYLELTRRQAA